ncbi:hypothetical protein AAG906_000783 [Vitis piasezkii]
MVVTPLSSTKFSFGDVLRNSGSHSDVLISHDPVLPSSLHPTHTHTVADLTLSQSHSIPPSCVQTGNPRLHKMTTRSMNNIFKPKQLHLVSKHPIPLAIEPTCVTQAVNHPQWRDAMSTELTALMKHGTWDLVPTPPNCTPVGCKWVFRVKRKADGSVDKFKARLASHYSMCFDYSRDEWVAFAKWTSTMLFTWNPHEAVYMMQPPGFKDTDKLDHVCRLRKAIYGLDRLLGVVHTTSCSFQLGFKNSKADSSLLFTHMVLSFAIFDMGNLTLFTGVEVIPTRAGLFLSQHQYIRDLLSTTNMLGAKDTWFSRVIGSLHIFHPTGHFVFVNKLSQFMHKPTTAHWTATKRLLRYLKQTIFHGIQLTRNTTSVLTTFSDADWAGNVDDRTSTSAYISFLGTNPISWSSKKQRAVARSSTEAEYRALANAASETVWLNSLLHELGFPLKVPPLLLCDNLGATHLSFNPVNHSRMKHIQIDLHFVRELVQNGTLHVRHVHTQDQLADLLTKPLSRQRTELLRTKIGLADGSSILRGRIKEDCQNQDQVKPS